MRKKDKNITVKVIFDRKHKATKALAAKRREAPVVVEVYYDGRRTYFQTGVRVYSDQFKSGRVCNHWQQANYNERIRGTVDTIEDYINMVYRRGDPFRIDELKSYVSKASVGSGESFLEYMEGCISTRDIAESTRLKHHNILRRLRRWGRIKSFSDVTSENIASWHKEAVRAAEKSAFSVNYDRVLRIYVRMAVREGLVKNDPYSRWKVPKYTPAQTHRGITLEEVRMIEAYTPGDEAESAAKDLFLFQTNTGMAYVDTQAFNPANIRRWGGWVSYDNSRVKTSEPFFIPMNKAAQDILARHGGAPPKIELGRYNYALKRLAKDAGLNVPLSSHWARHTFATVCINNGMPIDILAKILGHTNTQTTQIYARLQQSTINNAFDAVMKKIGE